VNGHVQLTPCEGDASLALTIHYREVLVMRLVAIPAAVLILGTSVAVAQNVAVIKERKDHYKAMAKATKEPNAMFKGEAEFDLAKVQAALKVIEEKAAVLPKLFPDDSKTGEDTEALPKIWEAKADFDGRFVKLSDAAKAAETKITDAGTFPDVWKDVMGNCSGCHKIYRKPKS
jgi:cytochrome c556